MGMAGSGRKGQPLPLRAGEEATFSLPGSVLVMALGGGQAVEACLSWLETVTQISGNWDRKVPREACVESLLKVSPHCMFL